MIVEQNENPPAMFLTPQPWPQRKTISKAYYSYFHSLDCFYCHRNVCKFQLIFTLTYNKFQVSAQTYPNKVPTARSKTVSYAENDSLP